MQIYQAKNRFLILLIGLLSLILFRPTLVDNTIKLGIVVDFLFSFLLVSCVFAVSHKRYYTVFSTLLALPFLCAIWGSHFYTMPQSIVFATALSGILFFGSTIYLLFRYILVQKEVSIEVIYGAIVVYLLMGVFCSLCYWLIAQIEPNAFYFGHEIIQESRVKFLYFSYITLTTLGYGDITPVAPLARSIAMLEAILGQIYLVVIIAWLVGVHVSQSLSRRH